MSPNFTVSLALMCVSSIIVSRILEKLAFENYFVLYNLLFAISSF
jgi:hypothetical protein